MNKYRPKYVVCLFFAGFWHSGQFRVQSPRRPSPGSCWRQGCCACDMELGLSPWHSDPRGRLCCVCCIFKGSSFVIFWKAIGYWYCLLLATVFDIYYWILGKSTSGKKYQVEYGTISLGKSTILVLFSIGTFSYIIGKSTIIFKYL